MIIKPYPKCPVCKFEQNDPSGHTATRVKLQLVKLAEHRRRIGH